MTLATFAALMLLSAEPSTPTQADERAAARERYTDRMHTELSFGYLGEWRDDSSRSFEPAAKDAPPGVDVMGDVEKVSTTLVIDGAATRWSATGFSLGARSGVRVQVSQVFLQLAGEASVLGGLRYGGSLQAGVAF